MRWIVAVGVAFIAGLFMGALFVEVITKEGKNE